MSSTTTMRVEIDNSGRFIQVQIPEGTSSEQAAMICLSAAAAYWKAEADLKPIPPPTD